MNTQKNIRSRGFTLIELLVVIAIIGILAGMLLAIGGRANQMMKIKRATGELAKVGAYIEAYKAKMGHYPPDNPNNAWANSLYYELVGCKPVLVGGNPGFVTLDSASTVTALDLGVVGANGIVNAASGQGDDSGSAQPFLRDIKPGQFGVTNGVRVLGVKIVGPTQTIASATPNVPEISPYRYNSSTPTNNTTTFDLWVDVTVGKKTYRINNWRSTPDILP